MSVRGNNAVDKLLAELRYAATIDEHIDIKDHIQRMEHPPQIFRAAADDLQRERVALIQRLADCAHIDIGKRARVIENAAVHALLDAVGHISRHMNARGNRLDAAGYAARTRIAG